jgi:hypothetical protein
MFFQRAVRRWHGSAPALPRTVDLAPRATPEAPPG